MFNFGASCKCAYGDSETNFNRRHVERRRGDATTDTVTKVERGAISSGAQLKTFLQTVVAVAALGVSFAAAAQSYPARPIRIVVPFAAGSPTDLLARVVAQKLTESLGTTIVDNRPGANGIIATDHVAKSPADGYTIELGISGTHGSNAALYAKLPYDPVKDFEPIMLAGQVPFALFASNAFPAKSVKEMVTLAKANPGKYSVGTTSAGIQLTAELLKISAGIDLTLVPYKSQATALVDLSSGNLNMLIYALSAAAPQMRAGQFQALAVTSSQRSKLVPELPTFTELGYPELNVTAWFAFYAPAGTPKPIVARLHDAINNALRSPDVQKTLLNIGVEVVSSTPEELAKLTQSEIDKWKHIVKEAKIPPLD